MRVQWQWPDQRKLLSGVFKWEYRISSVGNPYHTLRDAHSGFHICVIWFDKEPPTERETVLSSMQLLAEIKHDNKDYK